MKRQIGASILGIAAAAALMACASKAPMSSTRMASTGAQAQDELSAEYQSLIDNASKPPMVCRRQSVTGSRLQTREVCLTQQQLAAEREQTLAVLNQARPRIESIRQPTFERSMGVLRP